RQDRREKGERTGVVDAAARADAVEIRVGLIVRHGGAVEVCRVAGAVVDAAAVVRGRVALDRAVADRAFDRGVLVVEYATAVQGVVPRDGASNDLYLLSALGEKPSTVDAGATRDGAVLEAEGGAEFELDTAPVFCGTTVDRRAPERERGADLIDTAT